LTTFSVMMVNVIGLCVFCLQLVSAMDTCDPNIPSRPMPSPQPKMARLMSTAEVHCGPGQFRNESTGSCQSCPAKHFMTLLMSSENYQSCETCLEPGDGEIEVRPCNATRDTEILCKTGLYRYEVPNDRCHWTCQRCDVCGWAKQLDRNYVARSCGNYTNTVCCPDEDMIAREGECVGKVTSTALPNTSSPKDIIHQNTQGSSSYNLLISKIYFIMLFCFTFVLYIK
ncbi:hypothetical protein BgiMline_035094, partial [Biomphalaria glabrata]